MKNQPIAKKLAKKLGVPVSVVVLVWIVLAQMGIL